MRRVAGVILLVITILQAPLVLAFAWSIGGPLPLSLLLLGAAVLLSLEVALTVAWARIALRLLRAPEEPTLEGPRPDRRPPILPVDEETLADVPEPVSACPDCGFLGIRMPGIRDGLWPGGGELGDRMVCPRCGYQGLAVRFEKREEYGEFLRDLNAVPHA